MLPMYNGTYDPVPGEAPPPYPAAPPPYPAAQPYPAAPPPYPAAQQPTVYELMHAQQQAPAAAYPPALYGQAPMMYATEQPVYTHGAAPPPPPDAGVYGAVAPVPAPLHMHDGRAPHGHLAHDLLDCATGGGPCCDTCLLPFFCAQCQTAKMHSWLLHEQPPRCCGLNVPTAITALSVLGDVTPSVVVLASGMHTRLCSVGGLVTAFHHWYVRHAVVRELHIPESACDTCLKAFFCTACSSVQLANTLVSHGVPARLGMN